MGPIGLISIGDIELATNTTIDDADVPQAQYLIDIVSAYIETETGRSFSPVIDQKVRAQADGLGMIEIADLTDVSMVQDWRDDLEINYWDWDGLGVIYGLYPREVVDITISYGFDETPLDIAGVITDLVASGLGLETPTNSTGGTLKSIRTGDVEDEYAVGAAAGGPPVVSLSSLQSGIVQSYKVSQRTLRLSQARFPSTPDLPTL